MERMEAKGWVSGGAMGEGEGGTACVRAAGVFFFPRGFAGFRSEDDVDW